MRRENSDISIEAKSLVDDEGNLYFDVGFQEGDERIEKRVSAEIFISLLDGNLRETEKYVSIPKLASNIYSVKISSIDKSSFDCLCVYKAEKRAFAIAGQFFRLPYPALLMVLKVRKGARNEMSMFALNTDSPTDDSELYLYPFGNVYEDGKVCMGNIVSKTIRSIQDVDFIFDDFISGITNEHLYRMQNNLGLTQLELVKYIEHMDSYPVELLKPANKNISSLKRFLRLD